MRDSGRDWHAWYADYDDPTSSLSRRLAEVRRQLTAVLTAQPDDVMTRLVSLCAGDGRDTLPVLAESGRRVDAVLVELDPLLSRTARTSAADLDLEVEVRTADAGHVATVADRLPCDVLMLCGIFGNISDDDVAATVAAVPAMLRAGGSVIWTRGRSSGEHDPSRVEGDPADWVRARFLEAGLVETAYVRPSTDGYRVGVHRVVTTAQQPLPARLFRFV